MNKTILLLLFVNMMLNIELLSQVNIGPEVGISYSPYELFDPIGGRTHISKRGDLRLGIIAELPFTKKWHANTRFSYVNRENLKLPLHTIVPIVESIE